MNGPENLIASPAVQTGVKLGDMAARLRRRLLWRHLLVIVVGALVALAALGGLLEGLGRARKDKVLAGIPNGTLVIGSVIVYLTACLATSVAASRYYPKRLLWLFPLMVAGGFLVIALMELGQELPSGGGGGDGGGSSSSSSRPARPPRRREPNLASALLDPGLAAAALGQPVRAPESRNSFFLRRYSVAICNAEHGPAGVVLAVSPHERLSARAVRRIEEARTGRSRRSRTRLGAGYAVGREWVAVASAIGIGSSDSTRRRLEELAQSAVERLSSDPAVRRS